MKTEASTSPAVHSQNIQKMLTQIIDHAREDIERVTDPKFQALLETSAEVLGGLRTAFRHFGEHREKAWR